MPSFICSIAQDKALGELANGLYRSATPISSTEVEMIVDEEVYARLCALGNGDPATGLQVLLDHNSTTSFRPQ